MMKGTQFKEARKALGLNQQELADKFGVSRVTVGNIEGGDVVAPVYVLALNGLTVAQAANKAQELADHLNGLANG